MKSRADPYGLPYAYSTSYYPPSKALPVTPVPVETTGALRLVDLSPGFLNETPGKREGTTTCTARPTSDYFCLLMNSASSMAAAKPRSVPAAPWLPPAPPVALSPTLRRSASIRVKGRGRGRGRGRFKTLVGVRVRGRVGVRVCAQW